MGTRSNNFIALKPGIHLTDAVKKYLNDDTATITKGPDGTLILYETNFTPMWARSDRGENCTHDLEEEVAIQRFLGSIGKSAFYMVRAGDTFDYRGEWTEHAFRDNKDVTDIQKAYTAATTELRDDENRAAVGTGQGAQAPGRSKMEIAIEELIARCGGDPTGECKQYPYSDYKYERDNHDTRLENYWEWVVHQAESNDVELESLS